MEAELTLPKLAMFRWDLASLTVSSWQDVEFWSQISLRTIDRANMSCGDGRERRTNFAVTSETKFPHDLMVCALNFLALR
jgi:hypothetical protein